VLAVLAEQREVEAEALDRQAYWHQGRDGVRHLFRVAGGLESQVLGEHQIVHQVKTAYEQALAARCTGPLLNPLFQRALGVAKEVRTQTALGRHQLSVASVAVDLARRIHGDLTKARLLVIGAGEVAELAMTAFADAGVGELSLINRTEERAAALAGGKAVRTLPWLALVEALAGHDIVVSSTAAPHAVVTVADVREALRHRQAPLLLIDLAVPRDIEAAVGALPGVHLYDIDHLDSVVTANHQLRHEEIDAATAVVDGLVEAFVLGLRHPGSLLAQVAGYFRDVIAAEEQRLAARLGTQADPAELRYGLERVGNKLQHRLLRYLREHPGDARAETAVREILGIDSEE
jgi:glutamyl-tRNA reductase